MPCLLCLVSVDPTAARSAGSCAFELQPQGLVAYRMSDSTVEEVCVHDATSEPNTHELISKAGWLTLEMNSPAGDTLRWSVIAKKPGVYRFFAPRFGSRQVVVWWPSLGITRLFVYLSFVSEHGNRDDSRSDVDLETIVRERRISVTCGTISRFIQSLLHDLGITSRLAVSTTLRSLNQLDDGHIMLEVWWKKKWFLFDPDSSTYFGTKARQLGVADLQRQFVPTVGRNITSYGNMMLVDNSGFVASDGTNLSFLEERSRLSNQFLTLWYRRVLGRVGVLEGDQTFFASGANESANARVKYMFPSAQFVAITRLTSSP
jgi:hypothetical protein